MGFRDDGGPLHSKVDATVEEATYNGGWPEGSTMALFKQRPFQQITLDQSRYGHFYKQSFKCVSGILIDQEYRFSIKIK